MYMWKEGRKEEGNSYGLSITDTGFYVYVSLGILIHSAAAAAAKLLQSCPTLCDPIDGSPPASPVPGILRARTLEWVGPSLFLGGNPFLTLNSQNLFLDCKFVALYVYFYFAWKVPHILWSSSA